MPHNMPYDIGEDRRDAAEPISAPGAKRYYPGMTINDEILPLLKNVSPGQTIRVDVEIKITGTRIPEDYDSIQKGNFVSFDTIKIGIPGSFKKGEPEKSES